MLAEGRGRTAKFFPLGHEFFVNLERKKSSTLLGIEHILGRMD
jgi:hypothetical protein